MLAALERERQDALERADAFRGSKDRRQAKKAARAASEAIAEALEAADEAVEVAHAGTVTRSLEAAADAKRIGEYLALMEEVKRAAEDMEDESDIEDLLLLG
jgi:hypothetical protein